MYNIDDPTLYKEAAKIKCAKLNEKERVSRRLSTFSQLFSILDSRLFSGQDLTGRNFL